MATLRENRYGKTGVRLIKVTRSGNVHSIAEWTVRVLLEGEFTEVYLSGDNTDVLATDTMKNTVYSRAKESGAESMEDFAAELTKFLLDRNPRVSAAEVHIESALWKRLTREGDPQTPTVKKGWHPAPYSRGYNAALRHRGDGRFEDGTVRLCRLSSG